MSLSESQEIDTNSNESDKKRKRSSTSSVNEEVTVKTIDRDIIEKYSPSTSKTDKKKRKVKFKSTSKGKMDRNKGASGATNDPETGGEPNSDVTKRLDTIMQKLDCVVTKDEIIDIVKSTIQQEMEQMADKIKTSIYESISHRLDIVESETHKTIVQLDTCKKHIKKLESEIQEKDEAINKLRRVMERNNDSQIEKGNDLEQYSRSNNIKIINLPEKSGDRPETTDETTEEVVKFLKEKMKTNIEMKDIDIAHRLGKKNTNKPRTVIVRFISRRQKFLSMTERKAKLRGTGIYIVEDLTRLHQRVFTAARNNTEVESCWTRNGHIVVKYRASQRIEQIEYRDYKGWTGDIVLT